MKQHIKLNASQSIALKGLEQWFYDGTSSKIAILHGEAGMGKTTIVYQFLHNLGRFAVPILSAPFNEAAYQLRQATHGQYTVKTTYAVLGFAPKKGQDTVEFTQFNPPDLSDYTLLIIDEIGTAGQQLLDAALAIPNMKILGIGHKSQLPPVVQNVARDDLCISPAFTKGYPTFELTEPMRNTGELYQFCKHLEYLIYNRGIVGSQYKQKKSFLTDYIASDNIRNFANNSAKILCYTNEAVDQYNMQIRKGLFGDDAVDMFVPSDKVILCNPAFGFIDRLPNNMRWISTAKNYDYAILSTNTKGEVLQVSITEIANVSCYELLVMTDHIEFSKRKVWLYVPIMKQDFDTLRQKMYYGALYAIPDKQKQKWKEYHDLFCALPNVKHSYCMTVHRSQGSTIPISMVANSDINLCHNPVLKAKLRYVAASRASQELYML